MLTTRRAIIRLRMEVFCPSKLRLELEFDRPVVVEVENPDGQEQVSKVAVMDLLLVVAPFSEVVPNFCE